ncbi:MAG: TetR family transcriptional regulator [Hyphomicrobiaceae bacterium]|nr:TetR family transcriptional regulator [Hyphomicrobiaceae bacterium]
MARKTEERSRSKEPARRKETGRKKRGAAQTGQGKSEARKSAPSKSRLAPKPEIVAKSETVKRASAGRPGKSQRAGRPRRSAEDADAKRQHILKAALQVFSEHGLEAARLDEVASIAGVAKGTLYLYYPNKQAMFEALVMSAAEPLLTNLSAIARESKLSPAEQLASIFALFRREILGTERKLIVRLILAEGPRFPELAAFYHREVISHVLAALRGVAARLRDEGQLSNPHLLRFPQLIAAPMLLSIVWDGLFDSIEPLDVEAMLAGHAEILTAKRRKRP